MERELSLVNECYGARVLSCGRSLWSENAVLQKIIMERGFCPAEDPVDVAGVRPRAFSSALQSNCMGASLLSLAARGVPAQGLHQRGVRCTVSGLGCPSPAVAGQQQVQRAVVLRGTTCPRLALGWAQGHNPSASPSARCHASPGKGWAFY